MSPIQRPTRSEVLVLDGPAQFRAWLEDHHATAGEAWIGYYRKGVDATAMSYLEAVEEALCFGWIDGITYRVDDQVTATRFTPRRKGSNWSAVNIAKAERLIADGRMTPAGLAAFERRDASARLRSAHEHRLADLPPGMLELLRASPAARHYWEGQSASYRRSAAFWVTSAKRETTRQRRLAQLIDDSAAGRPIKPLASERGKRAPR